jgi:endonuclease/exonuclease/phosphatase family metal-dependent hydrolase/regulation of enolase protein 1 (concanavalin A-like superfamily)
MRALLCLLLFLPAWADLAQAQTVNLRVMTYNIHHNDTGSSRIAGVVANAGADVVGIQEVPPGAAAAIAAQLTQLTGRTWTSLMMPTGIESDAILSTYPLSSFTYITMYGFNEFFVGSVRTVLQATLEVPDASGQPHRLQFFVTHLSTNQRLDPSFPSPRSRQVDELLGFAQPFPGPRVVVGDFNLDDSRGGADLTDYQKLTSTPGNYTDSFRQINPTAAGKTIEAPNPDRRFDYVFYTRTAGFNAVASEVIVNTDTDTASDHYPVFTDFTWDGSTSGEPLGGGSITREVWEGIAGSTVADLTGNPAYPGNPTRTETLSWYLQSPASDGDSYGQRIRGYVTAPETGNYTFWIASDNEGELWLSPDEDPADKQKIAWVPAYTYPAEWGRQETDQTTVTQRSAPIPLVAGRRYYIEVLHKENGGGDSAAAGWQLPSGLYERPIPARRLSPFSEETETPPPAPWQSADIGAVGTAGSARYPNGTFTVEAGGTDLWDTADAFHYVYQTLTGDGEIVADVTGLTNPSGATFSLAGVMIREQLTAGSVHATMMITTEGKAKFRRRTTPGGTTLSDGPSAGTTYPPRWLKLVRSGDTFSAFLSSDGSSWTPVHTPQTVPMAATVSIGLVALRNGGSATTEATFEQVAVRSLPSPWREADIGSVGTAGKASASAGVFTIDAGGTDLWDTADAFHFVYQPMSGDGEIVANVTGLTVPAGSSWSLAAVMVREKLTPGSVHASMMITTEGKAKFRRRTAEGGTTLSDGPSAGTTYPPRWLRLTRAGNTFTAYLSNDGVNWTQVHTPQTVTMGSDVWVGLAVLRNGGSSAAQATVRDVSVVP